jgi:hypothetical protein
MLVSIWAGGGCASAPIPLGGVDDLRNLILRTLNDNQILILSSIARQGRTMTSLLRNLSEEYGIPLSTLKLNARILRELNLVSYGSNRDVKEAEICALGAFVLRLLRGERVESISFSD